LITYVKGAFFGMSEYIYYSIFTTVYLLQYFYYSIFTTVYLLQYIYYSIFTTVYLLQYIYYSIFTTVFLLHRVMFITDVKGTFFGMSESEEASEERGLGSSS